MSSTLAAQLAALLLIVGAATIVGVGILIAEHIDDRATFDSEREARLDR